jgi:hypothetical protein
MTKMKQTAIGKHSIKTKPPKVATQNYQHLDNLTISCVMDHQGDKLPQTTTTPASSVSSVASLLRSASDIVSSTSAQRSFPPNKQAARILRPSAKAGAH